MIRRRPSEGPNKERKRMAVPDEMARLVERFERNEQAYLQGRYNETQLRREFVDPFFKALGWDVDNRRGYAEAYKDVIHEDAIRIGGATKAPDYCFRIGGTRKFFLEAKKPSVNIRGDPGPAYQLRRYAWSAKLPLSILTDFQEFAVYDCRVRPHKTDKPSAARIKYLKYGEYLERWDEIASIFSREAVLNLKVDYVKDLDLDRYGIRASDYILPPSENGEAEQPPAMYFEALDLLLGKLKRCGLPIGDIAVVNTSAQQHGHVYLNIGH